ncbi:MAG: hypothetical protein R3C20_17760 [Planctomycetaceae bacterium]
MARISRPQLQLIVVLNVVVLNVVVLNVVMLNVVVLNVVVLNVVMLNVVMLNVVVLNVVVLNVALCLASESCIDSVVVLGIAAAVLKSTEVATLGISCITGSSYAYGQDDGDRGRDD